MGKRSYPWRPFKYPWRVYRHWGLNRWNFFLKPKLKRKLRDTKRNISRFIR
jgi:hypothetical protein